MGLLAKGFYGLTPALQIGEGGMLLMSATPLQIGQPVVITFKVPGQLPDIVRAVVRYEMPVQESGQRPLYGCEFVNLDFKVKRDIRNYVASQKTTSVTVI